MNSEGKDKDKKASMPAVFTGNPPEPIPGLYGTTFENVHLSESGVKARSNRLPGQDSEHYVLISDNLLRDSCLQDRALQRALYSRALEAFSKEKGVDSSKIIGVRLDYDETMPFAALLDIDAIKGMPSGTCAVLPSIRKDEIIVCKEGEKVKLFRLLQGHDTDHNRSF